MATIGYLMLLLLLYIFLILLRGLYEEKGHGPCGSHGEQSAIVPGQVNSSSSYARTAFRGLFKNDYICSVAIRIVLNAISNN